MNLLADTHVLIWLASRPAELSDKAQRAIRDPANTIFFSHASVWELEIKISRQKIDMPGDWIEAVVANGFAELPIQLEDVRASARLPWHHRDPFDRLLVAQAKRHGFTLMTRDVLLCKYDFPLLAA